MIDIVGIIVIGSCVLITCCCLLCGKPEGDNLPKINQTGKLWSYLECHHESDPASKFIKQAWHCLILQTKFCREQNCV